MSVRTFDVNDFRNFVFKILKQKPFEARELYDEYWRKTFNDGKNEKTHASPPNAFYDRTFDEMSRLTATAHPVVVEYHCISPENSLVLTFYSLFENSERDKTKLANASYEFLQL